MTNDDPLFADEPNDDARRPEDLERDIHRTRANLSGTLDAISSKLTPGQMMDQAMNYMRTSLPADFAGNLADSVRNNPMPVALIGVGIAWMAMSGRSGSMPRAGTASAANDYLRDSHVRDPNLRDSMRYGRSTGANQYGMGTSGLETETPSSGPSATGAMTQKAQDLAQQARAGIGSARAAASDTLASTRDSVAGALSSTRESVASTLSATRERVGSTMASARDSMAHLSERSARTYGTARDSFSSMIEEQPLILGALGIAVGAAIGAAVPRTRQEDQLLGQTRDNLLHRASETARGVADQAADKARTALQTVTEKAHHALDERSGEHATASSSSSSERPAMGSAGGGSGGASGGTGSSGGTDRPTAGSDDAVTIRTTNVRAASSSTNDERPL